MRNFFRHLRATIQQQSISQVGFGRRQPSPAGDIDGITREACQAFKAILGHQLSEVAFTMDYLQLSFDWFRIDIFTPPTCRVGAVDYYWNQVGFRDALCRLLMRKVTDVKCNEFQVTVHIGNDMIHLSLMGGVVGSEALLFWEDDSKSKLWVFHAR